MPDLFQTSRKAEERQPSPDEQRRMKNAAAVDKMSREGLFKGGKVENRVGSSSGIQSVMGGPGLDLIEMPRTEARKAEVNNDALHPHVAPLAPHLPPHSANLLSMIVMKYEASQSEPVSFDILDIAKHYGLAEDAAERAVGALVSKGLIVRAYDGIGAPQGWRPILPDYF